LNENVTGSNTYGGDTVRNDVAPIVSDAPIASPAVDIDAPVSVPTPFPVQLCAYNNGTDSA
jgi:hypothetical protein